VARLKLHLLERTDFIKFHDPSLGPGGLFVPGTDTPGVGDPVTIEVVFQGGPRVLLQGIIRWRRTAGDARARAGIGVEFEASETAKLNYLHGYVRGGLLDVREKRRLPVRLRVAYHASPSKGRRVNFTRDLNEEGAFVRTSEVLAIGTPLALQVYPPGGEYRPIGVGAQVARHQAGETDRGAGVIFTFRTEEEGARWRAFVAKLEGDYLDGKLPDDVLL
jgi:Tfp pilus assembly protein PilZ